MSYEERKCSALKGISSRPNKGDKREREEKERGSTVNSVPPSPHILRLTEEENVGRSVLVFPVRLRKQLYTVCVLVCMYWPAPTAAAVALTLTLSSPSQPFIFYVHKKKS